MPLVYMTATVKLLIVLCMIQRQSPVPNLGRLSQPLFALAYAYIISIIAH